MDYPEEFSEQARARVEVERLKAGRDLEEIGRHPEARPHRRRSCGPYGLLWTDAEEDFHNYILRVFLVFAHEACELGKQSKWTVDRIRSEVEEFLRTFTIEACHEKGHDSFRRVSNWNGNLLPEVRQEFRKSEEWRQFKDELLTVAQEQAAMPPVKRPGADGEAALSGGGYPDRRIAEGAMNGLNLMELPQRFQDAFEAAKATAELEYVNRAEPFPHHPQFAESGIQQLIRVQIVFFAYCAEARNACREGMWTAAQVSQSVDAAWPVICDSYSLREHGASSDEAKARFRLATWRTVQDDLRWKQHLSELVALAGAATTPSSAPRAAARRRELALPDLLSTEQGRVARSKARRRRVVSGKTILKMLTRQGIPSDRVTFGEIERGLREYRQLHPEATFTSELRSLLAYGDFAMKNRALFREKWNEAKLLPVDPHQWHALAGQFEALSANEAEEMREQRETLAVYGDHLRCCWTSNRNDELSLRFDVLAAVAGQRLGTSQVQKAFSRPGPNLGPTFGNTVCGSILGSQTTAP